MPMQRGKNAFRKTIRFTTADAFIPRANTPPRRVRFERVGVWPERLFLAEVRKEYGNDSVFIEDYRVVTRLYSCTYEAFKDAAQLVEETPAR